MNKYTEELKSLFKQSEIECYLLGHEFVGTEHLVLSLLKSNNQIRNIFNKHNINYKNFKNCLLKMKNKEECKTEFIFYTSSLKKIIETSELTSDNIEKNDINITNIILKVLEDNSCAAILILKKLNADIKTIYKEIIQLMDNDKSLLLKEIGIDITAQAKNKELDKVIGREKEIERIIEILARKNKNNPVLLGEAGVGKTAIIEGLATLIIENKVPTFLRNKTIISLNLASVISGTKYRGEFEEKMGKIIKELENKQDLILFIDEIHTLVGAGGAEGAIDASNILKPVLARGKVKCIGATTLNEYKKTIEKDKALDRRFQKIIIEEPNINQTKFILKKIKKDYETYHQVKISNEIIDTLVELSDKYILDRNEPDRSIDVLDEVCAKTNVFYNYEDINKKQEELNQLINKKSKYLNNSDFYNAIIIKQKQKECEKYINKKTLTPIVNLNTLKNVLESKTNSKIYELESLNCFNIQSLNKEVLFQKEAIKTLSEITLKHNNKKDKLPTSILFIGSSGIGKTLLANKYAQLLNIPILAINLNEYKNEISINKILGSPQGYVGYSDTYTTFEQLKTKQNSLIILENIDECHHSVLSLLLSIIKTGKINNSKGETLKFNNNIFILTSNKKHSNINIGFIKKQQKNTFDENEIINQIDEVITFNSLNKEQIEKIITLEFKKNNHSNITKKELNEILLKSNYETCGASKIKNLIKKYKHQVS